MWYKALAFNRTFEVLKYSFMSQAKTSRLTFNRTFEVLKCVLNAGKDLEEFLRYCSGQAHL